MRGFARCCDFISTILNCVEGLILTRTITPSGFGQEGDEAREMIEEWFHNMFTPGIYDMCFKHHIQTQESDTTNDEGELKSDMSLPLCTFVQWIS